MESQVIRDLLWVLHSPNLIDGPEVAESVRIDPVIVDQAELAEFIHHRSAHRVGYYFENLVRFWLERIRRVTMVPTGGQIRDGKRTVGEIDFLFRDEAGQLNHWETTVKFFLHFPNNQGSHFPGPNATDNFERKINKLFDKQLRLSEKYYPDVTVRRAFVRGIMFYHPIVGEPSEFPDRMSPAHLRGKWIRESELHLLDQHSQSTGKILLKPHWLAPPTDGLVPVIILQEQLQQHFANSRHPVMLSIVTPDGSKEIERMFVAPDCWPRAV